MLKFIIPFIKGSLGEHLQVSENNSSRTFVELLRGRDGLPGRDGMKGPPGPQGKEGSAGPRCGGATYTRWGKSTCPEITGTQAVYTGITAGSHYTHSGGGANHLCMPKVPEYNLTNRASIDSHGLLYGAEYESPIQGSNDHNVPCAVCHVSTRSAVLMIPGNTTCPENWTREYYGYLMSEFHGHKRSMYECVDRAMESLPGSYQNINGALFYHVEAECGVGLPCPPYIRANEINCVVCTK